MQQPISIVRQTRPTTASRATSLTPRYRHQSVDAKSYESEDEKEYNDDDCDNIVFLNHRGLCVYCAGEVEWIVVCWKRLGLNSQV